jgi:hypothetical protein
VALITRWWPHVPWWIYLRNLSHLLCRGNYTWWNLCKEYYRGCQAFGRRDQVDFQGSVIFNLAFDCAVDWCNLVECLFLWKDQVCVIHVNESVKKFGCFQVIPLIERMMVVNFTLTCKSLPPKNGSRSRVALLVEQLSVFH